MPSKIAKNRHRSKAKASIAAAVIKKLMKQNLGKLDRILRFALAVWWLSPLAPQFGASWANFIIAFVGWVALIESLIGWCGLHRLFRIDNKNQ